MGHDSTDPNPEVEETASRGITMPHLSGIDLHRAIAARHPALAARFVFMTGGAAAPEVQTFLDEIPNPRLEKPFDNEDVRSTARRLVDAGSRRRAKS